MNQLLHIGRRRCGSIATACCRMTASRSYMGAAGEGVPNLSAKEVALIKIAKPKSDEIMRQHVRMPDLTKISKHSFGLDVDLSTSTMKEMELNVRRKRLVYRSKQRGWLEVDLLLGTWASIHVPTLSSAELDEYEAFVNTETIDIYNIITLRIPIGEDGPNIIKKIQKWARKNPLGRADPVKYKEVKSEANLI